MVPANVFKRLRDLDDRPHETVRCKGGAGEKNKVGELL
jgi:hypothetical protein